MNRIAAERPGGKQRVMSGWVLALAMVGAAGDCSAHAANPVVPAAWPVQERDALLKMPESTPETRAATARLVQALTSPDFATREAASKELAEKGPGAFPELKEAAAETSDPELKARTSIYFAPGVISYPPNAPHDIVEKIPGYLSNRENIFTLTSKEDVTGHLQLRNIEADAMLLEIVTPQEQSPVIQKVLREMVLEMSGVESRLAMIHGDFDKAETILRGTLETRNPAFDDLAALLVLRAGASLDVPSTLDRLKLTGNARAQLQALLERDRGNLDAAARVAVDVRVSDFYRCSPERILIDAGRYSDLAAFVVKNRRQYYDLHNVVALWLVGDDTQARQILADLEKSKGPDDGYSAEFRARTDDAQGAIAANLRAKGSHDAAFHMLCAQLRIREALALIPDRKKAPIEYATQLSLLGLQPAARQLLKDIVPSAVPQISFPRTDYFFYAANWDLAGDHEAAAAARRKAFEIFQPAEVTRVENRKLARELAQLRADPSQRARIDLQLARLDVSEFRLRLEDVTFADIPELPDSADASEARQWFEDFLTLEDSPASDLKARFEKAVRIVQGKLTDEELNGLIADTLSAIRPAWEWPAKARYVRMAVDRFHKTGHDAAVETLVKRLAEVHTDPMVWSVLGDLRLETGKPAEAAEYYRRAAVMNLTDASLMYRLGLALTRGGDAKAGDALTAFAPLLVLGDDGHARDLADAMARFEGQAKADAWYAAYSRRYVNLDIQYYARSLAPLIRDAESRGDYASALDLQKKMQFCPPIPQRGYYAYFEAYMLNVAEYHRLRALDAWTRKDFPTVADALWREMDNGPPDVVTLQKLLPPLKAADPAAATRVLTRALDRLRPVVADYPDAITYRDQLRQLEALR